MVADFQPAAAIVLVPLFGALLAILVGMYRRLWAAMVAVAALGVATVCAALTLAQVVATEPLHYRLGGWAPPVGIEYVIDELNAVVLCIIAAISFIVTIFTWRDVVTRFTDRLPSYYACCLLLVTGLVGITITGDVFNLYVLLEISSLSSYALIALGRGRSYFEAFRYLIMGTIGASFYLLGIGYLYIMTGTLNMADLRVILPDLYGSPSVRVACCLMMVGLWIKAGLFPLHGWLPNAYTYTSHSVSCLLAPLATKVAIYVMLRLIISVFTPAFVFDYLSWGPFITQLAAVAIVAGSLYALAQRDLKRMFTYLIVAEVGYMIGGAWLANENGLIGAVFHILADALMTAGLFMFVLLMVRARGGYEREHFAGIFAEHPYVMAAFCIVMLSMIGVPPTSGFFSKWYLLVGASEAGAWWYIAALIFSSVVNAVLFFRIIEAAFFSPAVQSHELSHQSAYVTPRPSSAAEELPLGMTSSFFTVALAVVLLGVFSSTVVQSVLIPVLQW